MNEPKLEIDERNGLVRLTVHNCTCPEPKRGEEYPQLPTSDSRFFGCEACNGVIVDCESVDGSET